MKMLKAFAVRAAKINGSDIFVALVVSAAMAMFIHDYMPLFDMARHDFIVAWHLFAK